MRRPAAILSGVLVLAALGAGALHAPKTDSRLKNAYRRPPQSGWTYVHLEGTPAEIGFQNGYLLAPEIEDLQKVFALELAHDTKKDWTFYRTAAKDLLWPHVEAEYREELQGIADGLRARGATLDLWDVVAMNADLEWPYYAAVYDKARKTTLSGVPKNTLARCFVITTSWGCGLNSARIAKSAGSSGGLLRFVAVTRLGLLSARTSAVE